MKTTFYNKEQPIFSCQWIVSPKYDLFFFIGSCVFSFLFLGVYYLLNRFGITLNGDSILLTYFLFSALFDHPHIFQTFSRTHFDQKEFQKRRYLYTVGLSGFILLVFFLTNLGYVKELVIFTALFGSWHVIRQHAGFINAYKSLNNDQEPIDNWIDSITFYTGILSAYCHDYSGIEKPTTIYGNLKVQFPSLPDGTGVFIWKIFLVSLCFFIIRQFWRVKEKKPINLPKILMMCSAVFTHLFLFFFFSAAFLLAEALETAHHTVQYQGWMMHYQKKRFPNIKRVALKWTLVALLYGIIVGVIEVYSLLNHQWAMWVMVPFYALILFHYYIDGKIWKFRNDPELQKTMFQKKI
ncbi:MAG: hypothetical protein ACI86H_001666 [bacterium]|jgi:hypothetical protein